MKKTLWTIVVGCFLLGNLSSCTDERLVQSQAGLEISGDISAATSRVALVDGGTVTQTRWEVNDGIGLYTSTQSNVAYKATESNKSSRFVQAGSVALESVEGNMVRAYYPYSAKANGTVVPLPYTVAMDSQRKPSAFMYGEATIKDNRLNLTFRHLYSYLKVTLSSSQYRDNVMAGCVPSGGGLLILSDEPISVSNATVDLETMKINYNNSDDDRIFYYTEDLNVATHKEITYYIPILPQTADATVSVCFFYPQQGNTGYVNYIPLVRKKAPEEGFQAGCVYEFDTVDRSKQKTALAAFYEATGGADWSDNTNWLSNKPLEDWFGLNDNLSGLGYVHSMDLDYNNLRGTLPVSFATLMDNAQTMHLYMNYLSGEIPEAVKNHDKWSTLGWTILPQNTRRGGGFEMTESNLYAPDFSRYDLMTHTSKSLYDIFAANKLTQVIVFSNPEVSEVLAGFSSDLVNHYLDYRNKGLGTIIYTGAEEGVDNAAFIQELKEKYGTVEGIHWMYGGASWSLFYGYAYVFDSKGQLVHLVPYSRVEENESVTLAYDKFLRSVLGEPEEHDEFGFDFYTSTDYSRDGEVFVIQQATKGKGVDLVMLGEGFVDKDMEDGGKYEQKMKEATDKLFSLEPYATLRDRFNVYGVKVVSPTAEFTEGAEKRINEDNETAFTYALRYKPDLAEDERLMVTVIYNTEDNASRSYCSMYSEGSFVAYNMGALDNTLIHEVGGHGIAKLADEYVEGGYETTTIPADQIQALDQYKSRDWGWFLNVDYRSDAATVNWTHLLADSRYADDDLGIHEGAYTYGKGCYRPSTNSMMRHNISWFNAPCREIIYKAVMTLSEGEGWTYDYEAFAAYDQKNLQDDSRSVVIEPTRDEMRRIRERHVHPKLTQGGWRDAVKR